MTNEANRVASHFSELAKIAFALWVGIMTIASLVFIGELKDIQTLPVVMSLALLLGVLIVSLKRARFDGDVLLLNGEAVPLEGIRYKGKFLGFVVVTAYGFLGIFPISTRLDCAKRLLQQLRRE